MRIEGLPALDGFAMVRNAIVGWDEHGEAYSLSDDHGREMTVQRGVVIVSVRPDGLETVETKVVRVRDASYRCLITPRGQLLCNGPTSSGTRYYDRFPGEYQALGTGSFACALDAAGRPLAINASPHRLDESFGKAMAPFETRPIGGLPDEVTSLSCTYGSMTQDKRGKRLEPMACAVDRAQALRCTDPALTAALERAADGVPIESVFADEHHCVRRRDGQARCVATHYFPNPELLAPLDGLDTSRGLVMGSGSVCALGSDGLPRCWGQHGIPQLGDGSRLELSAPVHVEGFDGAVELSHSGGITCARFSADSVRCFGRTGSTVTEPRELKLPEPIDRMVGAGHVCVRGRDSQAWYCRDAMQSFFGGSLPDHFTPLVDTRGRKLGKDVVSVALDLGRGIRVALRDGRTGTFFYSGRRQPLRIDMRRGHPEKMRELVLGGGIRADGRGEFNLLEDGMFVTRGPAQAIAYLASRPCFLDEAQRVLCYDAGRTRAEVVVTDVVALDPHREALGAKGEVYELLELDGTVVARPREGLPPMAQLAGPCGRSVDGEVWCWGTVEHLPGPPHRLEPRPVTFE